MITSVIAAVAALIGAAAGAAATALPALWNNRDSISAEDARSLNEFLRAELQEAVVQVVSDYETLRSEQDAYAGFRLESGREYNQDLEVELLNNLDQATDKLDQSVIFLSLVASDAVAERAQALQELSLEWTIRLDVYERVQPGGPDDEVSQEEEAEIAERYFNIEEEQDFAVAELVAQVRTELGSDPD